MTHRIRCTSLRLLIAGLSALACSGSTESSNPPPTVASVRISPDVDTVFETGQLQLAAQVLDESGRPIANPSIVWWTLDTLHARISATGLVTGENYGHGSAVIHARVGTVYDTSVVLVEARPVTQVILGAPDTMLAADSARVSVILKDSVGSVLEARPLHFVSTNPAVLSIDTLGNLDALTAGTATLQVTAGQATGTIALTVRELQFDSVWTGSGHDCALESTGFLWCWGNNAGGQVGAPLAQAMVPVPFRVLTVPFARASLGYGHTCAINGAGALYCWGDNSFGQLGLGTIGGSSTPRVIPGAPNLVSLTAGGWHTCGLTAGGVAYCWGRNDTGQLGVGDSVPRTIPTTVATSIRFSTLAAGGAQTCGLSLGGSLYCWGSRVNDNFLPDSTEPCVLDAVCLTPVPVGVIPPLVSLSSKGPSTCGRAVGAGFWCWGLPWPDIPASQVGADRTFVQLGAGSGQGCGLATDGEGYCYSEFGPGPLGRIPFPNESGLVSIPVSGSHQFSALTVGTTGQACGLALGKVWCWGRNDLGQLGNRVPFTSDTAIPIIGHAR